MPTVMMMSTSTRLPIGLLTAEAWDLLRTVPVYAAAESALVTAIRAAGGSVTVWAPAVAPPADPIVGTPADPIVDPAIARRVVWLAGPDGDPDLARRWTERGLTVERVVGSCDPPGAHLLDVVTTMDRLRSPGGCPWDAAQTHDSLTPYLLEEAYEAHDALIAGDLRALREELGDVLLQVAFHSRLAEELPAGERWSVDDVADELVAKLRRRHPHVFGTVAVDGVTEVATNWEAIKRAEKGRTSATDGVALAQPALALAAHYLARARRAGVDVVRPALPPELPRPTDAASLGDLLLAITAAAQDAGLDAEAAARAAALAYAAGIRAAEGTAERPVERPVERAAEGPA